jgi:hypothetical protein
VEGTRRAPATRWCSRRLRKPSNGRGIAASVVCVYETGLIGTGLLTRPCRPVRTPLGFASPLPLAR